jgi:8-oxo-dGTP diphosphatase
MQIQEALFWLWRRLPLSNRLRWWLLWLSNKKFLAGVSAVITNDRGQVLLFKHTYRPKYPWGLPSGWLKKQEDPQEAIQREIIEETGFQVSVKELLSVHNSNHVPLLDVLYFGCFEGGVFQPSSEVSEARFFDLDELPVLLPGQAEIILQTLGKGCFQDNGDQVASDGQSRSTV